MLKEANLLYIAVKDISHNYHSVNPCLARPCIRSRTAFTFTMAILFAPFTPFCGLKPCS